jgi:hypothetical protein
MRTRWGLRHGLAEPYAYSPIGSEPTCNCTPPALIVVADADTYMAATLKASDWAALSATQRSQALKSAQDALRTLRWCTDNPTCCGKDLAANYKAAASELALVLFSNSAAVLGAQSQLPTPVAKRQKFAVFEEEFFTPDAMVPQILPKDSRVGSRSPTVLRLYPWLLDLIGCWVKGKNETAIPMLRG